MLRLDDIDEDQIVFYDIETTDQFAPYCELKMIGVQYGIDGEPELVESWGEKRRFRQALANPDMLKVQFNGINFDDLVLYRNGFPVDEHNRHDVFLMAKTVAPRLPAYSLKYINWHYFGDTHEPEGELNEWLLRNPDKQMWQAPKELLRRYCLYDVKPQTVNLFRLFWEVVQRPLHWDAYSQVEAPMGLPMEEIMLRGGEYLNEEKIEKEIATLQEEKLGWEDHAFRITAGAVSNPNSTKQVGAYLASEENITLELTDAGNFSLKKEDVLDFLNLDDPDRDRQKIIRCLFEVRRINNTLSFYRNYLEALRHSPDSQRRGWIPKQYSCSGARTRRILSNSRYKINFQNPNEAAKEVIVVPSGWLGFWIDATQIENVVHIYESNDHARRRAYEADPNWNEYVWLSNTLLDTTYDKAELDDKEKHSFPSNPGWSMYKGMKTTKLAINFGMGPAKYAKMRRIAQKAAESSMALIHRACPAIRLLQKKVAERLNTKGYVQDVFGHIYSGDVRKAYKVVAYLIQGCGTGSLPKVQIRANYDTLHQWDVRLSPIEIRKWKDRTDVVLDIHRGIASYGVLNGTTHDENSGRISLALGEKKIIATLQQLMYNMTERFSPRFGNIPLRAKLYLSRTGANDREEVDINDIKTIKRFLSKGKP